MEPTKPRYQQIAAALRAALAVPGAGPRLSGFHLYCPQPRGFFQRIFREEPTALSFLIMLYLVGLNRANLTADGQPGREALYALLRKLGGLAKILEIMERVPDRQLRIAKDLPGAIEIIVDLHAQFKVAHHYLAALGAELDEAYHRQAIPAEVVAALPWEVTSAWLADSRAEVPWYRRQDKPTLHALAALVRVSMGFDGRLGTIFWDTMDSAELVLALPRDRQMALLAQLRGERLSDELLAKVFPIPVVVAHVPRERIATYFDLLLQYLGGAEFSAQAARPRQATPTRFHQDAAPVTPRKRSVSPPQPSEVPPPSPQTDDDDDDGLLVDDDGIEDAGLGEPPNR